MLSLEQQSMIWAYAGFLAFVFVMLALDLGVFNRKAHVVSVREAIGWSSVWITMGLSFAVFIYFAYDGKWLGLGLMPDSVDGMVNDGATAVEKYLTGYVVEKSLSVDNIFVMSLIFSSLAVPAIYQHRVLFWGILGALALRGLMIGIGAGLVARFHWVLYMFAAFLIITALRMLFMKTDEAEDPTDNRVVRLTRRLFPVTPDFHGPKFVVRAPVPNSAAMPSGAAMPAGANIRAGADMRAGALMLTPLAVALILIESTDLIFAVDSIPAIFAITGDPFIVFTSNVFAILGLRSLYFALAGMVAKFRYLKISLAMVLLVVGMKMLFAGWLKELLGQRFNLYLLGVVLVILSLGVIASLVADRRDAKLS
jgi:tellurite resistance protein TerC